MIESKQIVRETTIFTEENTICDKNIGAHVSVFGDIQ